MTETQTPTNNESAAPIADVVAPQPAADIPADAIKEAPKETAKEEPKDVVKEEAVKKEPEQLLFKKKEGEKAEEVAKDEKPAISYDIKLPDGITEEPEALKAFTEVASKAGLPQEVAQQLVDLHIQQQQKQIDGWLDIKEAWADETKADTVYGGDKLGQSIEKADKIVAEFGDGVFMDDIQSLGLGNKLSFIRFLNKVADSYHSLKEKTKDDSIGGTTHNGGVASQELSYEKRLWPNMN